MSAGVTWSELEFATIAAKMDAAKAAAHPEDGEGGAACELELGGKVFTAGATGAVMGSGAKRGPVFAYRFEVEGCVVLVMRRHTPAGETPNVRVQVGAVACLDARTPAVLFARVRELVACLGGVVEWLKVSRADVFADVEGQDVGEVARAYQDHRAVSRAIKGSTFEDGVETFWERGKATGLRIGRGLMFRAYDKRKELEAHPLKFEAWSEGEWNGRPPDVCTRYEWELNRDVLKTFGIDREPIHVERLRDGVPVVVEADRKVTDELERLLGELGALCEYLVHRWLRFAAADVDRTNTTRIKVAEFWATVQESLGSWADPDHVLDREAVRTRASVAQLVSMTIGCVETIAAVKGRDVQTIEQLAALAVEQLIGSTYGNLAVAERCGAAVESSLRRIIASARLDYPLDAHNVCAAMGEKRGRALHELALPRGTPSINHERQHE